MLKNANTRKIYAVSLNAENNFTYFRTQFTDGLRAISVSPPKVALVTLYWVVALLVLLHAAAPTDSVLGHLMQPLACILVVLGSIVLFAVAVTISAVPKGAYRTANAFQRIGLTNSAGEPPLPTKCSQDGKKTVVEVLPHGVSPLPPSWTT